MKNNFLKINMVLSATLILLASNTAYAGYDVVKATTIDYNKVMLEKDEEITIPTENDSDLPDFEEDKTISGFIKNKKTKFSFRKNKKELMTEETTEQELASDRKKQDAQEVIDEDRFQINADKITYDDTDGNVYAIGHVEIISKAQDVILKADNAILEKTTQTIKLSGNVKVIKDGIEMIGDTLNIDLNEENVVMNKPIAEAYSFKINAQESYIIANNLEMLNGSVVTNQRRQISVVPKRFYAFYPGSAEVLYDPQLQNDLDINSKKQTYRIDAKEIVVTSHKDHNSLVLKKSNIYFNNHKIFPKTDIEIISDKPYQVIETNICRLRFCSKVTERTNFKNNARINIW